MMSAPARLMESRVSCHDPFSVDPAPFCRSLDHGVFATDMVGGDRQVEFVMELADDIEIGNRRFDHQDVGSFLDVQGRLAQRLTAVGRIHLVAAAVAELRCDSRRHREMVRRRLRHI